MIGCPLALATVIVADPDCGWLSALYSGGGRGSCEATLVEAIALLGINPERR
jgi:hypothetical protein